MDIAVSVGNTEHAISPYESLYPLADPTSSPPQTHRNLQSPIPDLPPVHSPRRFHPPSRTSPSAPATLDDPNMDLPPPTLASTTALSDHHTIWRDTHSPAVLPVPDGQDHDRMETDEESHDSSSEDDLATHQSTAQAFAEDHEDMDTTPDEPHEEEHFNGPNPGESLDDHTPSSSATVTAGNEASPQTSAEQDHPSTPQNLSAPHIQSENVGDSESNLPEATISDWDPEHPSQNIAPAENPSTTEAEHAQPEPHAPGSESLSQPRVGNIQIDPSSQQNEDNRQGESEQQQGGDEDSSQEESSDEEERPYWAEFVEDTSGPDEQELEVIEQNSGEVDAARDHAHWESLTYETLEDPEYVPLDTGRIAWTVTPINGVPGNPNRNKIMRSPSVLIGGMYWNIKYYPRGNDGTEHLSVYIECSPKDPTASEPDEESDTSSNAGDDTREGDGGSGATQTASNFQETASETPEVHIDVPKSTKSSSSLADSNNIRWEVAAQVGCVIYNPNEPRVNVFRKSSHRFNPDDADWGWTRFHGPWESIHLRQRNERQALLRDDTLCFSAYIRTVKDDTKNLWWHPPKIDAAWNSFERIGVKSLGMGRSIRDSHIVAAVSCWLNLKPIVDLIRDTKIPNALKEPQARRRPLFHALQRLIEYMYGNPEDTSHDVMGNFVSWLDWYITDTDPPRFDVPEAIAVWQCLRRILNYEASGVGSMADAPDCFQDVLLLTQPDPWTAESPISSATPGQDPNPATLKLKEPESVQETIDFATSSNTFGGWEKCSASSPEPFDCPTILQIELHRQNYDKKARRWDKLTHRIELNENITYTSPKTHKKCDYTLFGMVVHAGALESQDFSSVLRPQGPGSRWIRYSNGQHHKYASCLTRAQAITAHEGKGDDSTGSAAVAYIVLYYRSDILSDVFIPPDYVPFAAVKDSVSSGQVDPEDPIAVRVFKSTLFESHNGRGLPDLWTSTSEEVANEIHDSHFPKSNTLIQVAKDLEGSFLATKDHSEVDNRPMVCRWWLLDTRLLSPRGLPRFISIRDETLEQAGVKYNGVRLWLHTYRSEPEAVTDNADIAMTQDEPSTEIQQEQQPSEANGEEAGDAVMTQDPPDESTTHTEHAEITDQSQFPATSPVIETQAPSGDEIHAPISPEQNSDSTNPEDAVMAEGQGTVTDDLPPAWPLSQPYTDTIYIFVKIFDSQAQMLRAVGSHVVLRESNVHAEVGRILGSEDTFEIYHEKARSLSENDRIRSSTTFNDHNFANGSIFIAHRQLSSEATESLLQQGKHPGPTSFFGWLRHNEDPNYLVPHFVNNAFGTEYTSAEVSYDYIHGQGTMIYTNGDAYVGNWVASQRSGHGTMAYASGDTYTGEWAHHEREGHGKMVYGKTNNVYEGGWKKGRRHGKGVMRYEVADEEMDLCKICYENEMDALLYDCGHVVACEECARQVDVCPVCRKNVRGVCKIWKS